MLKGRWSRIFTRLPVRLSAAVVILLALVLILSDLFFSRLAFKDNIALQLEQDQQQVARLALRIDQELNQRAALLEKLATQLLTGRGEFKDSLALELELHPPLRWNSGFSGFVVVDAQGLIISDYPQVAGRRGSDVSDRDYLKATRETLQTQRSQALLGRFSRVPLFILSAPVVHQGELQGFVVGYQYLDQESLFQEFDREFSGMLSELLVIDQVNQLYITAPDPNKIFQPLPAADQDPLLAAIQAGRSQGSYLSARGESWLFAASEVPGMQWLLVRQYPKKIWLEPVAAVVERYRLILLAGMLLVAATILLILHWLLAPVYRATRHLQRVLEAQAEQKPLPEEGPEDLRLLFSAINRLQSLHLEKDQVKEEMISVISHELRTPLTSILGALSLLKAASSSYSPDSKLLVDLAERNSHRLLLLVNDLLDAASLSKGLLKLNLEVISLQPLVHKVISEFQPYATERSVSLVLEPSPAMPVQVLVDPDRLQQVLNNLLSNAVKFSPRLGQVLVSIQVDAQWVRVVVKDEGEGIPLSLQHQMFERFVSGAQPDKTPSSGLGLSIVRQLMEAMNGKVGFSSKVGLGSSFYIQLRKEN